MIDLDARAVEQRGLTVDIGSSEYTLRPVSLADTARFLENRNHRVAVVRYWAMRRFLRAAFGWRWSYIRPNADPVSLLMARPAESRGKVIAALLNQADFSLPKLEHVL